LISAAFKMYIIRWIAREHELTARFIEVADVVWLEP